MAGSRAIPLDASQGEHTNGAYESQPPGTTRRTRNMRPYDARNRVDRECQRPGFSKAIAGAVSIGAPVRAVMGTGLFENIGELVIGDLVHEDDFTRSDTSAGDLGDWDGDTLSNDWYVAVNDFGGSTNTFPGDVAPPPAAPDAWDMDSLAAYSSGNAALISGNAVRDNRDDFFTTGGEVDNPEPIPSVCYFISPSNTKTDDWAIRLTFTMAASLTETVGGVGLFCYGDHGAVALGGQDALHGWGVYRYAMTSTTGPTYGDNNIYPAEIKTPTNGLINVTSDAELGMTAALGTWTANAQYTIELRKVGEFFEFYFNGSLVYQNTDLTRSGTPTTANLEFGFLAWNVGPNTHDAIARIDKFEVYNCSVRTATPTHKIVAVSGDDVYLGDTTSDAFSIPTGGTGAVNADVDAPMLVLAPGPSDGTGAQRIICLDGYSYLDVSIETDEVKTWTPDDGSLPVVKGQICRYGVMAQNRMYLYGCMAQPDNWWSSERGNIYGWNLTPTLPSINQPVAGDTSDAGIPTAELRTIFPIGEEWVAMASLTNLWVLDGNPADQGRLNPVSTAIGGVGPWAWAQDHRGASHFVNLSGHYVMAPGTTEPEPISVGRIDKFFRSIDHSTDRVMLFWDGEMDGLHIIVANADTGIVRASRFWSRRKNRYDVDTYPGDIGPYCVGWFIKSDLPGGAAMLLGCNDGYVLQPDIMANNDDGTAIDALLRFGPITNGGSSRVALTEIEAKLAAAESNTGYRIYAEDMAEQLDDASARSSGSWSGKATMQVARRRVGGGAVAVELYNDDLDGRLVIERIGARVERRGRVRGALR